MRLKSYLAVIVSFTLLHLNLLAQDDDAPVRSSGGGKSKTISLDGPVKSSSGRIVVEDDTEAEVNDSEYDLYQVIKLNPLLVLKGDFMVSYNRALTETFALEGALGVVLHDIITYSIAEDYGAGSLLAFPRYEPFKYIVPSPRSFNPGLAFQLQTRLYLNPDYVNDGSYIAAEIYHRRFSFSTIDNYFGTDLSGERFRRRSTEYRVVWGYQTTIGQSKNLLFDYYTGFGLGTYKTEARAIIQKPGPFGGTTETLSTTNEFVNGLGFTFQLGIRLGFGW